MPTHLAYASNISRYARSPIEVAIDKREAASRPHGSRLSAKQGGEQGDKKAVRRQQERGKKEALQRYMAT